LLASNLFTFSVLEPASKLAPPARASQILHLSPFHFLAPFASFAASNEMALCLPLAYPSFAMSFFSEPEVHWPQIPALPGVIST
jgi:hypothetical protein